jgi:hypothetical protein
MHWYRIRSAIKHWWQRRTRGWDDRDTWSLDWTIAKFVLPRLRRFREVSNGYPADMTKEEWDTILNRMIYALEVCSDDSEWLEEYVNWDRVNQGLQEFGKYFRNLWW